MSTTPTLRRTKIQVREFRHEDLKVFNKPWDFWGQDGPGPDEWGFVFVSTCKHTYEISRERGEEDTSYREFFQCTKCNEKMCVRITFGCPICKGRHLQFCSPEWSSSTMFCPDHPVVPFYKKDIRGAQLEVLFSS
jgi:hypothetical protein